MGITGARNSQRAKRIVDLRMRSTPGIREALETEEARNRKV
jgi:hypothetical protein